MPSDNEKRTRKNVLRQTRATLARATKDSGNRKELLPPETLRLLYSTMLQCRLVKERVLQLFRQGKLFENSRSKAGREASEVGVMLDLRPADCVAPRRHDVVTGYGFGCGLMPPAQFKHVFGQLMRPAPGGAPRVFPSPNGSLPLIIADGSAMAARLNISTGVALAYQARNQRNVVVAFSGDDSTALGSWHEAVDFAVTHKLPIVHIVQSDVWTEPPDPRLLLAVKDMDNISPDNSLPTLTVDGNDVVAVYRVAQEAIRRARQGYGPSLIECKMQPWPVTIQDPLSQGASAGSSSDPISSMEAYLQEKGLWSGAWKRRLVNAFIRQLDAAEKFAESTMRARV